MNRQRRTVPAYAVPSVGEPIAEVNTTPLIDVMLVLLIMFIITIPIATHGVKLDLPSGPLPAGAEPETHVLQLDAGGRLSFDGAPVAEADLRGRLQAMDSANPLATLHFRTEGQARYEDFDRVLAVVRGAGIDRLGFVGNHDFQGAF
jgi:biopolymer transport protein ExbD